MEAMLRRRQASCIDSGASGSLTPAKLLCNTTQTDTCQNCRGHASLQFCMST